LTMHISVIKHAPNKFKVKHAPIKFRVLFVAPLRAVNSNKAASGDPLGRCTSVADTSTNGTVRTDMSNTMRSRTYAKDKTTNTVIDLIRIKMHKVHHKCLANLNDINRMYKVAESSFQEKQLSSSSTNSCVQRVRLVLLTQDGPQRVRSSLDLCPGCTELPFVNTGRSTPASRTIPIAPPASDVAAATTQMNGSAIRRPSPRTVRTQQIRHAIQAY
jgi:hypothetical protein